MPPTIYIITPESIPVRYQFRSIYRVNGTV